jgi:hypothetical protein
MAINLLLKFLVIRVKGLVNDFNSIIGGNSVNSLIIIVSELSFLQIRL